MASNSFRKPTKRANNQFDSYNVDHDIKEHAQVNLSMMKKVNRSNKNYIYFIFGALYKAYRDLDIQVSGRKIKKIISMTDSKYKQLLSNTTKFRLGIDIGYNNEDETVTLPISEMLDDLLVFYPDITDEDIPFIQRILDNDLDNAKCDDGTKVAVALCFYLDILGKDFDYCLFDGRIPIDEKAFDKYYDLISE